MALDRQQVLQVAKLARLALRDDEVDLYQRQLGQILTYVEQLDQLDIDDVPPMAHAADILNVFAEDDPHASLPRDLALANAPNRDDECFRVPAVL